ncbi:MAG: site-2 protease family protein [Actinobacteria bacterium]|nr:site-2 protease family protein [Actinomycetota bacterium]
MRIARPFGIPVYISPYWFLIAGLFVVLYASSLERSVAGDLRYVVAAAFVILLYASVLVHELSHSLVARGFRLPVRRILLYPLGGFSEIENEPPTPGREFLVSAAGPVISLMLAAGGYGLEQLLALGPGSIGAILLRQLWLANLLVGLFNLLPGLPLDGGRLLRAGVWKVTGRPVLGSVVAAWAGRALAAGVIVLALYTVTSNSGRPQFFDVAWLALIAAFMWIGAGQALRATRMREKLPGLQARRLARRAIPIPASLPLAEAIRRADEAQARALVVVDHEDRPIAIVNEGAVMATPPNRRPWIDAGSLARSLDPGLVLPVDLSGMALLEAVRRSPATEYLVVEPSGQVYGVLAAADLNHAFARS